MSQIDINSLKKIGNLLEIWIFFHLCFHKCNLSFTKKKMKMNLALLLFLTLYFHLLRD